MKNNKKGKLLMEAHSYINILMFKAERDLTRHINKMIEKRSKNLEQQLKKAVLNMSEKSHQNNLGQAFWGQQRSGFREGRTHFNLSSNQLLSSLASEIQKNLLNIL